MYGFLYFADGFHNPITDEALAALDLSYAFTSRPMHGVIEGRTPSGGAGTIIGSQRLMPGGELAYRPDAQTWRKRPGDDCVWVGYWNDHKPTPEGLARKKQLPGELVKLADGNAWRVPRLMAYEDGSGFAVDLPCYADLDVNGQWCNGGVAEEFATAASFAERIYEGMIKAELGQAPRLTSQEVLSMSVQLLQLNYCIGDIEAAMLRLFKVEAALRDVVKAAADWKTFVAWCDKKKESVSAG